MVCLVHVRVLAHAYLVRLLPGLKTLVEPRSVIGFVQRDNDSVRLLHACELLSVVQLILPGLLFVLRNQCGGTRLGQVTCAEHFLVAVGLALLEPFVLLLVQRVNSNIDYVLVDIFLLVLGLVDSFLRWSFFIKARSVFLPYFILEGVVDERIGEVVVLAGVVLLQLFGHHLLVLLQFLDLFVFHLLPQLLFFHGSAARTESGV